MQSPYTGMLAIPSKSSKESKLAQPVKQKRSSQKENHEIWFYQLETEYHRNVFTTTSTITIRFNDIN